MSVTPCSMCAHCFDTDFDNKKTDEPYCENCLSELPDEESIKNVEK